MPEFLHIWYPNHGCVHHFFWYPTLAEDGQPLGGAWAQVLLECDGKMLSLDAAAQVFAQDVVLSDFGGVVTRSGRCVSMNV